MEAVLGRPIGVAWMAKARRSVVFHDRSEARVGNVKISFPGTPNFDALGNRIVGLDYNYDFKTDHRG